MLKFLKGMLATTIVLCIIVLGVRQNRLLREVEGLQKSQLDVVSFVQEIAMFVSAKLGGSENR